MVKLRIKPELDITPIIKNFKETEDKYTIDDMPYGDEFLDVDKETRVITHYGYNGLIHDWGNSGYLELADIAYNKK